MNPPFIPAEMLQRMITSALLQSFTKHKGVTPENVASFQLQQMNNAMSNHIHPPVVVPFD